MIVSDVFEDAKEVLGFCDQNKIFSRLTDAVETLANKGSWEPLLAYMDIAVQNDYYITLPNSVEVPLRINIEDHPAFPRDRNYEFTMNGPATNSQRVEWSWEDMGDRATVHPEDGSVSRATGRIIRISKQAVAVRMLVRLSTTRITSTAQFIPLHSKAAILLQLKALESYKRGKPEDFQLGQAQEAQALKFLQEEQQSRNSFLEISKSLDTPTLTGRTYHANGVIIVGDIYDEACNICGGVGEQHLFDRIAEALEVLSNKGQWDGMTAYLDMTPTSDVIGLPRQVEIPIRINIEKQAAFARNRLYEFSINGPGTDLDEVNILTWEDQGYGPLMAPLQEPSYIMILGNALDAGKKVTVTGIDNNDVERTFSYTVPVGHNPMLPEQSPILWKSISRIMKDETVFPVSIEVNGLVVAVLPGDETEPIFRLIKLNRKADSIKIMFRKSSLKIKSVTDLIPLKSRSAITMMLRSLQMLKKPDLQPPDIQMAQALEDKALKFLQEEEQSRLAYIQASTKDIMPALGIATNLRGVVIAADVYDDAADIFGAIGRTNLFDKMTQAHEMLANKGQWDGLDGYVDIISDQRGYITLPRHTESIIEMNFFRTPAQFRNKWYEFHMNGMGTHRIMGNYYDAAGEYPLVYEPTQPMYLTGVVGQESDALLRLRAYGYNNTGQWIRSSEGGKMVDGELVPLNFLGSPNEQSLASVNATNNQFRIVTRVTKDDSERPIQLYGASSVMLPVTYPDQPSPIAPPNPQFLAVYEADENEPMFRRIRVPTWVTWARMRFRVALKAIIKQDDALWLKNKTAIVTMMRALKALDDGKVDDYQKLDAMATKILAEEQSSRNPAETFDLQFDPRTCFADPLQGQY